MSSPSQDEQNEVNNPSEKENVGQPQGTRAKETGRASKKVGSEVEDSPFPSISSSTPSLPLVQALLKAGIHLNTECNSVQITDGFTANRCLANLQRSLARSPSLADELIEGLEDYVMRDGRKALSSLLEPLNNGDCILKIFLSVHETQSHVMRSLLQWVVEHAADEEAMEVEKLQQDLPRLLLYQLRFLNFIEDGEELASNLMECLSSVCQVCPESKRLPCEIINIIPEILEDAQHGLAVQHLKQILEEERELTVPIIETLSNLRVSEADMGELRSTVLQILGSAEFGDLPVAIQFLLESFGPETDQESKRHKTQVMSDLRERFIQICHDDIVQEEPSASQDSGPPAKKGNATHSTALRANNILAILQVLMRCLIARKDLCKTYLDTVDGAVSSATTFPGSAGLCVIDVWILVGLRSHSLYKRKVTTLIRQHVVKTNAITMDLIRASVRGHRDVLDTQFKHFLDLAGTLLSEDGLSLRQRHDGFSIRRLREVGKTLYVSLFQEFKEPYYRQELVVALVMHCGVSTEESVELEGGLECMMDLTRKRRYVHALEPFIEFIKTLIHSAPQMQLRHCRMVFNILSSFVVHRSNSDAGGAAWFHVLLRKLLTNPTEASRMAGAIGAVQLINAHARESSPEQIAPELAPTFNLFDDDDDEEGGGANGDKVGDDESGQAGASQNSMASGRVDSECKDVFDLALSSSRSNARTMATFCEELGAMVDSPQGSLRQMNKSVAFYMVEELNIEFMERFCTNFPETSKKAASSSSSSISSSKDKSFRFQCFGEVDATPLFDENKGSNAVAINFLPNLAKGMNDPKIQERYIFLASMLRGALALADVAGKRDGMSALLGAPMLLTPKETALVFFEQADHEEDAEKMQGAICLSIYHTINWTRELINGSVLDMEDPEVVRKIFARFDLLVDMHNLLVTLLRQSKSGSVFSMLPIQRNETPVLTMGLSSSGSPQGTGTGTGSKRRSSTMHNNDEAVVPKDFEESLRNNYRPFRMQVFSLLSHSTLESHPYAVKALLQSLFETVKLALNPKRSLRGRKSTPLSKLGQGSQLETSPEELLESLRNLMQPLFLLAKIQFSQVKNEANNLTEPVLVSCILTNCRVVHEIARCPLSKTDRSFRSCTERVLASYSSVEVDESESIADDDGDDDSKSNSGSFDEPLSEALTLLENLLACDSMTGTETKLYLVELLVDLVPFVRSRYTLEEKISKQCAILLHKSPTGQNLTKTTIGRLLELHLRFDRYPLSRMEDLINDMTSVAEAPGANGETFATLSIGTLPYFYEPVLRALLRALDELDFQSHMPTQRKASGKRTAAKAGRSKNGKAPKRRKRSGDESEDDGDDGDENADEDDDEGEDDEDKNTTAHDDMSHLESTSVSADDASIALRRKPKKTVSDTLDEAEVIVNLIRKAILLTRLCPTKKALLVMSVRQGRAIIERFMKIAMPFLTRFFSQEENQNKIVRIFRGLQQSTRQLQSICDSGKSNKDLSLVSVVPKLRKILEALILTTKGLCQASGTLSAFTTGNLKRRNVDGSLRVETILDDEVEG